jgi:outer membrane immunogenic protein
MMAVVAQGVSARIKEAVMRRCLVVLCLLGFVPHANAQDFDVPTLRGSSPFIPAAPKYMRWAGFYAGGQIGGSSAEMNFKGATEGLMAQMLRVLAVESEHHVSQWGVLGKANPSGLSYGAFVGYNTQWSDVVVGIDLHYNRSDFFANAPQDPIGRAVSTENGVGYNVFAEGAASMRITDYGGARLRGGWVIGNFLPYATLGVAVGRANIFRSARVSGTETVPCNPSPCVPPAQPVVTPFDFSVSETKNAHFIYGWTAGLGVDVMVMPNVFVRAEFEYVGFTEAQGIKADLGTARVGAGVKF